VLWRYVDERIEIYRTETRAFDVRALTLQAAAQASLGLRSDASREGFSSTSATELSSAPQDSLATVRARIEPFLSRAGVVVAEPGASAMLVVTDTPEVLRRVAAFVDRENRALTRRVRLLFEELTVALEDGAEAGIDWNLVFAGARVAATAGMAGAAAVDSGLLSVAVTEGRYAGSEMLIKALGNAGKVVRRNSLPILTLNRRPVTHAVRTTFSYIDKVETTAQRHYDSSLPSVSVSQREETVGSLLTLVPDAQEDGQVLLSVAYDNTVAQPLKSVTFGDSGNPLQLQQITIDGNGTVQQVALMPGQPLVISGFDRSQQESETRRLNPGLPLALGGSDRARAQRLTTVMVVTAHVEEGF
jgi:type IVB pilus formation R64 PilN family outer membrane protein